MILLIIAGAIELNPGPKTSYFTLGHINARSLMKDEIFDEISSFILDKKFDLFYLFELSLKLGLTVKSLMSLIIFQVIVLL